MASAALGAPACSAPPPGAPSPVIVLTPTTVCLGDDYRTPITLDGTSSSPALTLVPVVVDASAPPLQFLWTLSGSAYRITQGSLTSSKLVVTMAGDQPLQVDLRVQNQSGTTADMAATVSVTLLVDAGGSGAGSACPLGDAG